MVERRKWRFHSATIPIKGKREIGILNGAEGRLML